MTKLVSVCGGKLILAAHTAVQIISWSSHNAEKTLFEQNLIQTDMKILV